MCWRQYAANWGGEGSGELVMSDSRGSLEVVVMVAATRK